MVARGRPKPRRRAAPIHDKDHAFVLRPSWWPAAANPCHKTRMPTTPKTPADQQTSAPSPSPDSERYAARAAAPKAVARLYSGEQGRGEAREPGRARSHILEADDRRVVGDRQTAERFIKERRLLVEQRRRRRRGAEGRRAAPRAVRGRPPPPPSQDASPLPAHIEERLRQLQLPDAWAGEVRDLIQQSRDEAQRDVVDVEFDVDSTPPPSPEGEVWPSWTSPHKTTSPAKLWSPRRPPPNSPERERPSQDAPPGRVCAPPALRATRTVELSTVEDDPEDADRAVVVRQDSTEYGSSIFCGCTSGFGAQTEEAPPPAVVLHRCSGSPPRAGRRATRPGRARTPSANTWHRRGTRASQTV